MNSTCNFSLIQTSLLKPHIFCIGGELNLTLQTILHFSLYSLYIHLFHSYRPHFTVMWLFIHVVDNITLCHVIGGLKFDTEPVIFPSRSLFPSQFTNSNIRLASCGFQYIYTSMSDTPRCRWRPGI